MSIDDPLVMIVMRQLKDLASADLSLEERDFRHGELMNVLKGHHVSRVYLDILETSFHEFSSDAHVYLLELLLTETDSLERKHVRPLVRSFIEHSDSRCRFLVVRTLLRIRDIECKSGNGVPLGTLLMHELADAVDSEHGESKAEIVASFSRALMSIRGRHARRTLHEIALADRTSKNQTGVVSGLLEDYRTSIADSPKWEELRLENLPSESRRESEPHSESEHRRHFEE